jgi:sortase A
MWKLHKSISAGAETGNTSPPQQKQGRKVVIWIERILFVSGLALAALYSTARIESILTSRAALRRFAALEAPGATASATSDKQSAEGKNSSRRMDLPDVDFSLWSPRRVETYKRSMGNKSGTPLAVLHIPRINLEAPLYEGTDDITLNHAVGRIAGTARPGELGNIGIAGHRDGFFRGLKDVSVGDAIELKTLQGRDTYIVDRIQIVKPNQVEVLKPRSVPSLTLVTCYPFYFLGSAPQRYIVTASLSRETKSGIENLNLNPQSAAINSTRRKTMKITSKNARSLNKATAGLFVVALVAIASWAQDSTVTTIQHGQPSYDTEVKNAEIVYVEGNDLVLKLENGGVEHLVVPDGDKFAIDGKEVSVHELVPGTKLTQTITTTTTPRYVNAVRTIEGKVWHVNAPKSVILTLPDNTQQVFNVPNHAKFNIDGREKTVFDLRKGMKIKATIVTDDEHTVVESSKLAFGQAPPLTPPEFGVLLFLAPSQPQVRLASAEEPVDMLPETGSSLPLVGLMGALAIATSLGLWAVRRTLTI